MRTPHRIRTAGRHPGMAGALGLFVLAALLSVALGAAAARAEDSSLRASVDRAVAGVGEQITYTITVQGSAGGGGPRLPQLPDFVVYAAGSSKSFTIVNGKMGSSATFIYALVPKSPGRFVIGPAEVEADGKVYRSNSIDIEVRKAPPAAPAPQPSPPGAPGPGAGAGGAGRRPGRSDDFFVRATVDRSRVYVNQQVTWTFKFYNSSDRLTRQPNLDSPSIFGFWSEEMPWPPRRLEWVNGRQYTVTEVPMALFPNTPGRHVIGPATLRCQVEDPPQMDPNDPFSVFQLRGRVRDVALPTESVVVQAVELPRGPADFHGAVGRFTLEAGVDRREARQNEPVTLTVHIRGQGNLKAVPDPELPPLNNFKTYSGASNTTLDKTGHEVRGEKTIQTVLIPQVVGEYTLPGLTLVYFDPELKQYRTLRTPPIPLRVRAGEAAGPGETAGGGAPRAAGDVRFIRTEPASWRGPRADFLKLPWTWALEALPLAGWLAALLLLRWRESVRQGAAARGPGRVRAAARRLGPEGADFAARLAELQRCVAEHLCEALALPAGFTREQLDQALAGRGAPEADRAAVLEALDRQDRARFAPGALGAEERAALADGAERLVKATGRLRRRAGGRR